MLLYKCGNNLIKTLVHFDSTQDALERHLQLPQPVL